MPAIISQRSTMPSKPRCAPSRRAKPYNTRRRQQRPELHHPFDELPWISALNATPDPLCDIADLSQLPDPCHRPKPLRPAPDLISFTPPSETPATKPITSRPTTPLSRFIPSRVLFHNLMPVLCESRNDEFLHDSCTSISLQPSLFNLLSPRLN